MFARLRSIVTDTFFDVLAFPLLSVELTLILCAPSNTPEVSNVTDQKPAVVVPLSSVIVCHAVAFEVALYKVMFARETMPIVSFMDALTYRLCDTLLPCSGLTIDMLGAISSIMFETSTSDRLRTFCRPAKSVAFIVMLYGPLATSAVLKSTSHTPFSIVPSASMASLHAYSSKTLMNFILTMAIPVIVSFAFTLSAVIPDT